MKKIIVALLMMAVLMCGCGSSNKSDAELKDIEQFKCQDSIQTVFDVFGESEMEDNAYIGECYTYEDINLYGYNGKATFRVRGDKKTIAKFECSFELNKNEFEDVLSQLSNKYGEYEKNEYSNQIAYVWKIPEEMAGEMGYNQICLSDYGDKKAIIDFTDEWSIKTDEAYYEHLEEENKGYENEPRENKETIDLFEYLYDENNKVSVVLSKNKDTEEFLVSSFCHYEDGNLGLMQGDFTIIIPYPLGKGIDIGYFGTVGEDSYSFITSGEKTLMNTVTENEVQEFPQEYTEKFSDMQNKLIEFYKKYGIE